MGEKEKGKQLEWGHSSMCMVKKKIGYDHKWVPVKHSKHFRMCIWSLFWRIDYSCRLKTVRIELCNEFLLWNCFHKACIRRLQLYLEVVLRIVKWYFQSLSYSRFVVSFFFFFSKIVNFICQYSFVFSHLYEAGPSFT